MASLVPSVGMPVPNGAPGLPALPGVPDLAAPRVLPGEARPGGDQDPAGSVAGVGSFAEVLARVAQMASRPPRAGGGARGSDAASVPAGGAPPGNEAGGATPPIQRKETAAKAQPLPELVAGKLWQLIRRLLAVETAGGNGSADAALAAGAPETAMAALAERAQALAGSGTALAGWLEGGAFGLSEPETGRIGFDGEVGRGGWALSWPVPAAAQLADALAALLARLFSQGPQPTTVGSGRSEDAGPEQALARLLASDAAALQAAQLVLDAGQALGLLEDGDRVAAGPAGAPARTNGLLLDAAPLEPGAPGTDTETSVAPGGGTSLPDGQTPESMAQALSPVPDGSRDGQLLKVGAGSVPSGAAASAGLPGDAPAVQGDGGGRGMQLLQGLVPESQGAGPAGALEPVSGSQSPAAATERPGSASPGVGGAAAATGGVAGDADATVDGAGSTRVAAPGVPAPAMAGTAVSAGGSGADGSAGRPTPDQRDGAEAALAVGARGDGGGVAGARAAEAGPDTAPAVGTPGGTLPASAGWPDRRIDAGAAAPVAPGKEAGLPGNPLVAGQGATVALAQPSGPPAPGMPAAGGPAWLAGGIETQIVPVIVRQARLIATGSGHELVLRLQPESLGIVHVRLALQEDGLSVGLAAANPDTHRALEAALPQLRASLVDAGLRLQRLDVGLPDSTGGGESGRGFGGGGSGGPWNGGSGAHAGQQFGGQETPERAFARVLFDADGRPFGLAAAGGASGAADRPSATGGAGSAGRARLRSLGAYGTRRSPDLPLSQV